MTTVINLIGAPGAGKSTLAAGLFAEMKRRYLSVELVTEYAKDLTYDGHRSENMDQLAVFAEQHRRIARLVGKVDYVISDSPLFLSAYYSTKTDYPKSFTHFVLDIAARYKNMNFLVTRNHRYDPNSRSQDEDGANRIHQELIDFMGEWDLNYEEILAGDAQPLALFNKLFSPKFILNS